MDLSSRPREEPEINLTSLIDVVLLLLVFFMVTTSFVREAQITIDLPKAGSEGTVQDSAEQLEVSITAQGTYLVNGRMLLDNQPETLADAIRQIADRVESRKVTISADAQASHQAVVTAMDIAGKLGYVEVSIATVKPAGETE